LYQQRLGDGKTGFTSSPVGAGDRLYITKEEGDTYVLRLGRDISYWAKTIWARR
jgi:hypothetical protein